MLPSAPDSEDGLPQVFIDFKRKCETGKATPLTSFPLSKADYTRLHDKIQATFRHFDYDPQLEHISIRMPPALHDLFIREFGLAVLDAVREVGRQNKLVPLPRASTKLCPLVFL
ncbi:hypothetical protein FOXYS1_15119 [Fusarium oxysporum]|uniref:Uncharacterized protein n=1 Tax=Fusarium oxysporum TaxID=5507 RepID=A0A8H4ZJJ3_FUSOX|nr:hypothetical protein FOXYS1_15119 [Fusarium oxysporum]